jgi:hypothetical protein
MPTRPVKKPNPSTFTQAVVRVGEGGRGFVVEGTDQRLVITAAYCLPTIPPAHPWSYLQERTFAALFGALIHRKDPCC